MPYVIDYQQETTTPTINVPPWHSGTCGYLPGTSARIALVKGGKRGLEVQVRPYAFVQRRITYLTAKFTDEPGVLSRLTGVLAQLGANIVSMVSSIVDDGKNYSVELIYDWSGSEELCALETVTTADEYRLRRSGTLIGLTLGNVKVYQSIVDSCNFVLSYETVGGVSLPHLYIRDIVLPRDVEFEDFGSVIIGSRSTNKSESAGQQDTGSLKGVRPVQIGLPAEVYRQLRQELAPGGGPLKYSLLSEADTRTLHVHFHLDERLDVGFFHEDKPGAAAGVLRPLAAAQFTIVTSLIRPHHMGTSDSPATGVLEVQMNFKGEDKIPESEDELYAWIGRMVLEHATTSDIAAMTSSELEIGRPLHFPKRKGIPPTRVSIRKLIDASPGSVGSRLTQLPPETETEMASTVKSSVFLSYSVGAKRHADLIRKHLSNTWEFVEREKELWRSIDNAACFVGILVPTPNDERSEIIGDLSVAIATADALKKRMLLLYREGIEKPPFGALLDKPGVECLRFSDLSFESISIPELREKLVDLGRRGHNLPQPPSELNVTKGPLRHAASLVDFAVEFVGERAEIGVTPAELYEESKKAGYQTQREYIYKLLRRLIDRKDLSQREDGGRYFPGDRAG